ncbi:MAG TPA: B12-binding domain-containing radical SAM protein [Saprospirales bacterium]|nr:B12-binding domain-containing radical SAM protein [Saprospirales bacterium]
MTDQNELKKGLKILMVRPKPSPETIGLQHLMVVEPLELEILYALKRPQDEALIVDLIIEKKPFGYFLTTFQPDVVCFTGYITNVGTILTYCEETKKYSGGKTITVVGGVHCEVCPEDFDHPMVDFRVVRNASKVFTGLLDHIAEPTALPAGIFRPGEKVDPVLLPAFDFSYMLPDRTSVARYRHRYFYIFHDKVALVKTSYGCPYQCSFCFCRIITDDHYHQRPVKEVVDELENIPEKEIYIVDDDFLFDKKWLTQFITELRKRNISKHFLVYGRADFIARNPELMHEMAKTGLRTVIVGFESFSDEELSEYNKKIPAGLYKQTMEILNREKIEVFATIIVSPKWDRNDFRNMVRSLQALGIHYVNLQPLTPLPKTGVHYDDKDILIDRKEYEKWDLAHVTVQPEKMSVAAFYEEILKAYQRILYRPEVLLKYLMTYRPVMLYKMLVGGYRVTLQYRKKIKEAKKHA